MLKISDRNKALFGGIPVLAIVLVMLVNRTPSAADHPDIERGIAACALGFNTSAEVKLGVDLLKSRLFGGQGLISVEEIISIIKNIKDDAMKIEAMKVIHACTKDFMEADAKRGFVIQKAHVRGDWTPSHADGVNGNDAVSSVRPDVENGWTLIRGTGGLEIAYPPVKPLRNAALTRGAVAKDTEYEWSQGWYASRTWPSDGGVTHMETRAVAVQERQIPLPVAPRESLWDRIFG